jgi:hypothetical protein
LQANCREALITSKRKGELDKTNFDSQNKMMQVLYLTSELKNCRLLVNYKAKGQKAFFGGVS